jgi:hypothetical protein
MADTIREGLGQLAYAAGPWIEETRVKLGQGHYGAVHAVKIRGLQCAGKKFDARLFEKTADPQEQEAGGGSTTAGRFVDQCLQLAQVRHPNIVQLLGVLFDGSSAPTLVSEVLPLNLARCLEEYQHIPQYAKSSILLDVANGLRYAHEQKRPMVHGRLCPEKILLTISLQAKICGFVNPSRVTLPDSSYTAPEAAAEGGPLTPKSDVFSFGNLVLHVSLQQYPQPTVKEKLDPADAGRTITCSEVERREQNLIDLGETHALQGLVRRCLEDNPGSRPTTAEVLQEVEQHAASTPPPYASVLQVMQEVEQAALLKDSLVSLTQTLEGKQTELDAKQLEVDGLTQELEVKEKAFQACKDELEAYKQTIHSKERRMLMHDQALRAKDSLIKAKAREIVAKNQQLTAKESQLAASNRRVATLEERLMSGKAHGLRYPMTPQRSPSRSPAFTRSQQVSPTFKESPYKFSQSAEAEDLATRAGEVLRRSTPGRRGKAVPISDGFFYQNKFEPPKSGIYGQQQVDPKLAAILAKRHQRYEQVETTEAPKHLEPGQQTAGSESTSDQVQLRKQVENRQSRSPSVGSGMSPELEKLMNKRRSQNIEPPAGIQPRPEPPPTAPRQRKEPSPAAPLNNQSPPSVQQQQPQPQEQQEPSPPAPQKNQPPPSPEQEHEPSAAAPQNDDLPPPSPEQEHEPSAAAPQNDDLPPPSPEQEHEPSAAAPQNDDLPPPSPEQEHEPSAAAPQNDLPQPPSVEQQQPQQHEPSPASQPEPDPPSPEVAHVHQEEEPLPAPPKEETPSFPPEEQQQDLSPPPQDREQDPPPPDPQQKLKDELKLATEQQEPAPTTANGIETEV